MKHSEEEKKAFIEGWIAKHKLLSEENEKLKRECEFLATRNNLITDYYQGENKALMEFAREVDASLYHGSDLDDVEILQFYIEVFKELKRKARTFITEYPTKASQPPQPELKP